MRSLVDVRLGNGGVRTKVRVSEYGGRDAEGVDEQVGRGGWGRGWGCGWGWGVHWHCATDRGTQIRSSSFGGRSHWIEYCTFQSCRMVAEERTSCPDLTTPKAMVFEKVGKGEWLRFEYSSFKTSLMTRVW